jgi:DNA-binding CsgD family transcriptional regulator
MDNDRGLLSRTILSLYEDQNQNIWVGENNGISFIQMKSPFHHVNEEAGLPGTGYSALQKGDDLYLGTNNGVYLNGTDEINLIEGSEGQVYNLQVIRDDVLIGHNNGAFLMKNQQAKPLGSDRIGTWMFEEFNETILKGTYEGIDMLDINNYQKIGKIDQLDESSRIIAKENDSTLWMSHVYKGIYKVTLNAKKGFNTTVNFYNEQDGLPSDLFNSIHLIEGLLKVSTKNGIYKYNASLDRFEVDASLNKYFEGDQISTMQSDIYGNIYFITSNSVGFLEKSGNNGYQKHTAPFNSIRKLLNDDLPNINVISPNLVLFGAKEGFVVFDRNLFWTTEKEAFNTMIRQVQYNGEETVLLYNGEGNDQMSLRSTNDKYPEIAYNDNALSFYFSSSAFSATINPVFQYKLVGYDRDWQKWTESNFKEYTNLREGMYTFQVRSRNANNVESDISSYTFIIIDPWYRSTIAYIIYALLAISALIGLVLSIDKRHQQEKKKLEQKRLEELSEKEMQIDIIAKTSEDQISQLTNDKLESEIRHMNTELATNTMHILNKNEFINSIKSNLGEVTKKSTNEEVKKQIGGIMKNIEKNIETDGDWDNFQMHFDKVHGDFSTRLKMEFSQLSPQEIKLSTYLRLNLSTKEIANLLNISVRGVEIGRYRLRKKLNLDRSQNLAEFILNY